MANFTERLRQLRDESGKTQSQIAKELGLTPQAFSYFVNGREPNYETLGKIADYFQVSVDYLLGRSDVKTSDPTVREICEYTGISERGVRLLHTDFCTQKEKGRRSYVAKPLNALFDSTRFFQLLGYFTLFCKAAQGVLADEDIPLWVTRDMNAPETEKTVNVVRAFESEFGETVHVLSGTNLLSYYEDCILDVLRLILPEMAGFDLADERLNRMADVIRDRWNALYEKAFPEEQIPDGLMDLLNPNENQEAPNDQTH